MTGGVRTKFTVNAVRTGGGRGCRPRARGARRSAGSHGGAHRSERHGSGTIRIDRVGPGVLEVPQRRTRSDHLRNDVAAAIEGDHCRTGSPAAPGGCCWWWCRFPCPFRLPVVVVVPSRTNPEYRCRSSRRSRTGWPRCIHTYKFGSARWSGAKRIAPVTRGTLPLVLLLVCGSVR